MKKYEVILTNSEIGIFTGKRAPIAGQTVKIYVGSGRWATGTVYDVIR